jgi:hypothetical protein
MPFEAPLSVRHERGVHNRHSRGGRKTLVALTRQEHPHTLATVSSILWERAIPSPPKEQPPRKLSGTQDRKILTL